MAEHRLSESDNGVVIDADVGDVIELSLAEKVSGGYRWALKSARTDLLEPLPPSYEFEAEKVGGANAASFRFTVKARGKSAIRLEYERPWERGEPALRAFEVSVVAR